MICVVGKRIIKATAVLLPMAVAAMTDPPYDLYGYLADATDNPPLNYMKVCEPGRTGETNASYVVLGISYPRTYQAVIRPEVFVDVGRQIDSLPAAVYGNVMKKAMPVWESFM